MYYGNIPNENGRILSEMLSFIQSTPGISYYDLKAYAYDNDKEDWLRMLRSPKRRSFISLCIRDFRRDSGKPYNNSLDRSLSYLADAEANYRVRHAL